MQVCVPECVPMCVCVCCACVQGNCMTLLWPGLPQLPRLLARATSAAVAPSAGQTYVYYLWWIMAWPYRFQNGLSLQQQQQQQQLDSVWHTHTNTHTKSAPVCVCFVAHIVKWTIQNFSNKSSSSSSNNKTWTRTRTILPGDTSCQTCRLPLGCPLTHSPPYSSHSLCCLPSRITWLLCSAATWN